MVNSAGIQETPGVVGGDPCIERTRIPVWLLVQARKLGTSESTILESFPALTAQDLINAWVYYRLHQEEIDQQILENESA